MTTMTSKRYRHTRVTTVIGLAMAVTAVTAFTAVTAVSCKKVATVTDYSCENVTANVSRIMKEMSKQTESVERCKAENFSPVVRKCMATAIDLDALALCFPTKAMPARDPASR